MNPDYDLARPLASALKAKAPYVGIPIPGHAPLIFKRSQLQGALCGVKPVSIEVTTYENGERYLTVAGVAGPRCRTSLRIRSIHRNAFHNWRSEEARAMKAWKPSMVTTPPAPRNKNAKYENAIAKLERQLKKLGSRPRLNNPCLAAGSPDYYRDSFLRWHQQKDLRREIGKLGAMAKAGEITDRKFYVALAKITTVKRYSDFTENQRARLGVTIPRWHNGFLIYADPKNLWKFLPDISGGPYGHTRPRLWGTDYFAPLCQDQDGSDGRVPPWGTARYYPVLNWSNQRRELLSLIENIRTMIQPNAGPALAKPPIGDTPELPGLEPQASELAA